MHKIGKFGWHFWSRSKNCFFCQLGFSSKFEVPQLSSVPLGTFIAWLDTVSVFEYFCPKLFKSARYDFWLFQLFLAFFNSLYQELSGYVSQISFVLYIYPQEVQEHRLFCSFAWKIRFLLLAHVGKKVKNFTGAHMCTQTQLFMNNLSPTNMPITKNQVQLGALKV